jgi:hypothetical protein
MWAFGNEVNHTAQTLRLLADLARSMDVSMSPVVRRGWPVLAVAAGLLLIFFEYRLEGGITGDNAFWLFVGALVVVLGVIDLMQKRPEKGGD